MIRQLKTSIIPEKALKNSRDFPAQSRLRVKGSHAQRKMNQEAHIADTETELVLHPCFYAVQSSQCIFIREN